MKNKYSNKYLIETGIGLQDVDNLKNSSYFINESERYIKGEITLEELEKTIASYYENKTGPDEYKEADLVASRISKLISDDSFTFSVGQLLSIHKELFKDVYGHAGKFRTYNFSKKEWVLDGASVWYGDYHLFDMTLQYDFEAEKNFNYIGLSKDEILEHLAIFVSNLWQIHPFEEGNTRVTAVFFIKYLRSLGYDVTNDSFAKHSQYFRNSLVRANYYNLQKGIAENRTYLIKFLRNLLFGENNVLKNRELHVSLSVESKSETRENRIVGLIKRNPKITTAQLSSELGVSVRTVKSLVATLQKDGLLKRVGGKKLGSWLIKK